MKNLKGKFYFILFVLLILVGSSFNTFAGAQLDPTIPDIASITLDSSGTATWVKSAEGATFPYKKFELQLLKRTTVNEGGLLVHKWKTHGQKKTAAYDEDSYDFIFTSVGYYRVQIRGYNLDGNYSNWTEMPGDGVPVDESEISPGGGGGGGGGSWSEGGPGVVNNYPNGGMNLVIGPNGEIYYSNYHANNSYSSQQYLGPGYSANTGAGANVYGPGGVNSSGQSVGGYYMTVPSPFNNNAGYNQNSGYNQNAGNSYLYNNNGNNNYQGGGGIANAQSVNSYRTPNITNGLEVGWHVDNNGRFYYQGNGVVLKDSWFKIDGYYYSFDQGGYARCKVWYKDPSNQAWYYLAEDGKMLVGWQKIDGAWYYLNPNNGSGYGSMYANTSLFIQDSVSNGYYAFGSDGRMVASAWYGGYYYGSDGRRTNS